MEDVLSVQHLDLSLFEQQAALPILRDICFTLRKGEIHALVGESGSGKSMTANAIMQLLPASMQCSTRTDIILDDEENLAALSQAEMCKIRGKRVAMIFQEPMSALNPVMRIGRQIKEVALQTKAEIIELLISVGLAEKDYDAYPHQLSGGMRQRVMIAMALAGQPEVLIADEPTTALDTITQKQILDLLLSLAQKHQLAVLLITHDLKLIEHYASFVSLIYYGELIEQAPARAFLAKPLHPYAIQLLETAPSWQKRNHYLSVIKGQVPKAGQIITGCCFSKRCRYTMPECETIKPQWQTLEKDHTVKCHLYPTHLSNLAIRVKAPESVSPGDKPVDVQLAINNLSKSYKAPVLENIHLQIMQGECFALVGGSGSGKTTLAKIIAGLETNDTGTIFFKQQDINLLSRQQKARAIQLIFQDPFQSLNPKMTVFEMIREGLQFERLSYARAQDLVVERLEDVGLSSAALTKFAYQFSGGQRQRIAIARALAMKPELLICDEPTSALDISIQAQILNLLKKLQAKHGLTILLITHNFSVVAYLAEQVAVLERGHIVEAGNTQSILQSPQNQYTNQLITASFL